EGDRSFPDSSGHSGIGSKHAATDGVSRRRERVAQRPALRYAPRMHLMLTPLVILLAQAPAAQAPAGAPAAPSSANTPSVFISAEEIAGTLKASIANNVVDQPIKAMDVVAPSGHRASLAMLRRTRAETTALIHNRVTEIYQITEGSGTLVTGGTL